MTRVWKAAAAALLLGMPALVMADDSLSRKAPRTAQRGGRGAAPALFDPRMRVCSACS
jgi:hypothetical protein